MAFTGKIERNRALTSHIPLLICFGALLMLVGCTGGASEPTATPSLPTLASEAATEPPTLQALEVTATEPPTQATEIPTEQPTQVAEAPTTEAPPTEAPPTEAPPTEAPPTEALEEPSTAAPPTIEEGEATEPSTSTEIAAPTEAPTSAPEQTAEATTAVDTSGLTPVSANADWSPVEQDFDGIVMVLVPAGCFPMGRDGVSSAEAPEQEQCFDAPFWFDKTEVTNAQFALYENVAELSSTNRRDDAPRDSISQREAATFCAMREGRLPTEREWEYAASGPSNLVYPWGDEWVGGYAVWERTSRDRSELAGSRPQNTSWVGAIDLSGNVWEWTSTIDKPYPYDAEDGRESSDDVGSPRIIRGGSWANQPPSLTTSFRLGSIPTARDAKIGFRCVRDTA